MFLQIIEATDKLLVGKFQSVIRIDLVETRCIDKAKHTIKEGKSLKDMSLEEMDAIWNEAKKKGL